MIDNRFDIMTTISKEEDATYLHVQDYLFSDFVIKAFNPKKYASYQEAAEAIMREKKLSILFEGHPNIVQAFGGSIEGVYLWKESKKTIMYSIHEHCQINTVKSIMESEGTFSVEAAIKVMKEILCALKFMHEREFAHLNLCLDNIWLDQSMTAKLAKAEKAQYSDCSDSKVENKTGVSYFKAPEMAQNWDYLYDPFMADIYSLAIWVFEMITGHQPSEPYLQRVFYEYDWDERLEDYLNKEDLVDKPGYECIPSDLKILLSEMTLKEPLNRPSIEEIVQYPLFN